MDLVFEIGTEELPAGALRPAVNFLREALAAALAEARLLDTASVLRSYATPRRLCVTVQGLQARAPDVVKLVQGPPVKSAFGPDGQPTKAGEGFARKLGVPIEALRRDGERVVVEQQVKGQTAGEALPAILEKLVAAIPFRKVMRWGELGQAFSRPVHWIGAALDGEALPVAFGGVKSGLTTRGHRFHAPGELPLPLAGDYLAALRARRVLADWDERKSRVWAEVQRAAREAGPGAEPLPDDELLETVTGLVEEPTGVLGRFEQHFTELPPEVLVSEMRGHQKYFAVRDAASGKLLPAFVAVSNTRVKDAAVSRRGYERVLRARLSDGRFFFDEDRKVTLASRLPRLERIVFFQGLGTQADRVQRLGRLAAFLQQQTGLGNPEALARAALLCKTDLTCGMVSEFPELQGIMGATYARLEREPAMVFEAIEQHYWPRSAEAAIPRVAEGTLLALADRLDQLAGFFGVGKEPTGTSDPFALRRAAIGLLRILLETGAADGSGPELRLDLRAALVEAQRCHAATPSSKVSQEPALLEKLWSFVTGRLEVLWKDRAPADAIAATLGTGARDLRLLQKRLDALVSERTAQPERFAAAAGAFKRIGNILGQAAEKGLPEASFALALARLPSEQALAVALGHAGAQVRQATAREDLGEVWAGLALLRPAVDRFFDEVMVMDPDAAVRDNRLALLRRVHELFAPLAEFSRLQT